jgi:hypothetical protein
MLRRWWSAGWGDRDFGNSYPWVLSHDSPEGEEATRGYDDVKYFLWDTPPYENIDTLAIARINKFVVNGRDETAGDSADDDEGGGQGQGDDDAKPASVEENEEMVKEAEKQGKNVLIKLNVKIRTKSQFFGTPAEAPADHQQAQPQAGEEKEEGEAAAAEAHHRGCVPRQLLLQKRYTDPFTYTRVQELLYDLNDSVKRAKSSDGYHHRPLAPLNSPAGSHLTLTHDTHTVCFAASRWLCGCWRIRRRGPSRTPPRPSRTRRARRSREVKRIATSTGRTRCAGRSSPVSARERTSRAKRLMTASARSPQRHHWRCWTRRS